MSTGPKALLCRIAAIHHENRAGEERGVITRHEGEKRGDFVGGGHATDWMITAQHVPIAFFVPRGFRGGVHDRRIDSAARNRVYANVVLGVFDCHLARHLVEGAF